MKNKQLLHAIGGIDDKYIEAAEPLHESARPAISFKRPLRGWKLASIAVSLLFVAAIAVFGESIFFHHSGKSGVLPVFDATADTSKGMASTTDPHSQADSLLRGLPVENFSLADVQDSGVFLDRMLYTNFGSLFQWGIDCFAVVKVDSIQTVKGGADSMLDHQYASVRILKSIYGNSQSDILQISQSIIENHFCLGTTNLLRQGAVYILPLKQYDDIWFINGDMDVLFEVDDEGKVWSHSAFEEFNQYDGRNIDSFLSELQTLTSNEDFLLANSTFSSTLESWTLADITVTSKSERLTNEHDDYFNYSFTVNEVLSMPDNPYTDHLDTTGKIMVYADEDDEISLEPGKRYCIYLDCYEGIITTNARMMAEIQDEGTIHAILAADNKSSLGYSVFASYDGCKMSEIKSMIARIDSWQKSHTN